MTKSPVTFKVNILKSSPIQFHRRIIVVSVQSNSVPLTNHVFFYPYSSTSLLSLNLEFEKLDSKKSMKIWVSAGLKFIPSFEK